MKVGFVGQLLQHEVRNVGPRNLALDSRIRRGKAVPTRIQIASSYPRTVFTPVQLSQVYIGLSDPSFMFSSHPASALCARVRFSGT
jgi:hypothetical protein